MTKAQQKRLVGSVAVDESLLTPVAVRALMTQCADSAVAKSEVRLEQRFEDRLSGVETSMGSLESTVTLQLKAVAQELKSEIQQSRFKGKGGGDRGGKGGWGRPRWQQPQQQQQGWQQQQSSPWSQPANPPAAQSAPPMGPAGEWGSRLQFISKDKPLVSLYIRLRHRHTLLLNHCLPAGAKHRVRVAGELRSNESSRSE